MDWLYEEPRLDDILSDPIVKAVMDRDGVEDARLRLLLDDIRALLARKAVRVRIPSRTRICH